MQADLLIPASMLGELIDKWEKIADDGDERARKGEYTIHPLINPGMGSHILRGCASELRELTDG